MTLVLTRSQAAGLLELPALAGAIEAAFRARGEQRGLDVLREHLPVPGGAFHLVVGGTLEPFGAWTVKVNAHFGAPSGMTALFDVRGGGLVALMDSAHLTAMRTAAMTMVVLRALGAAGAERALLIGAGRQGAAQAQALALALPALERLEILDADPAAASALARRVGGVAVDDCAAAAAAAQVIVTVTPARTPVLPAAVVRAGAVVLAFGADAPGKQEHDPALLDRAHVVCDIRAQARAGGELQHGGPEVAARTVELADVIAARAAGAPGASPGEPYATDRPVVFDATGTAMQDAIAAAQLVAAARRAGRGQELDLTA